jgi:hypothetical protein
VNWDVVPVVSMRHAWKYAWLPIAICLMVACGKKQEAPEAKEPPPPKPVQILQFYPSNTQVARGEHVLVCYGVENAKTVRLEPAIEQIVPAYIRCFQYSPQKTTEIKLVATGADGSEVSKSFQVAVVGVAPAPKTKSGLIVSFVSSAKTVAPGQEVTLCYETRNATAVKLEPSETGGPLPLKGCVSQHVKGKTQFTLIASGPGGKQDRESLTVSVP